MSKPRNRLLIDSIITIAMNNLKALRKEKGFVFKRDMAQFLGVHETNYGKMENEKMDFSKPLIEAIEAKFPDYSLEWVLHNVGPKFKAAAQPQNKDGPMPEIVPKSSPFHNIEAVAIGEFTSERKETPFIDLHNGQYILLVPLIEPYAHADYLKCFNKNEYINDLPKHTFVVTKHQKGRYFAFRAVGEAMDDGTVDSIPENSIVTGRETDPKLWTSRFHFETFKDYIIVHKEGILIKRIIAHDAHNGTITCESRNPDKTRYPTFDLQLDDCIQILTVVNITQNII